MTWWHWRRKRTRPADYDETVKDLSIRTQSVITRLRDAMDDLEQGILDDSYSHDEGDPRDD